MKPFLQGFASKRLCHPHGTGFQRWKQMERIMEHGFLVLAETRQYVVRSASLTWRHLTGRCMVLWQLKSTLQCRYQDVKDARELEPSLRTFTCIEWSWTSGDHVSHTQQRVIRFHQDPRILDMIFRIWCFPCYNLIFCPDPALRCPHHPFGVEIFTLCHCILDVCNFFMLYRTTVKLLSFVLEETLDICRLLLGILKTIGDFWSWPKCALFYELTMSLRTEEKEGMNLKWYV